MTREEAKELLPIIQAFAEGKAIQDKIEGVTDWIDTGQLPTTEVRGLPSEYFVNILNIKKFLMKHLNRLDKRQLIMMVNIIIKEMIITFIGSCVENERKFIFIKIN